MIRIVFYSKLLAERSNIEYNVQGLKKVLPILSEVIIVSENIRSALLREMKEGSFANQKRLPRETVLSEQLGISRTQLRDELASLEREGFITRRHGVGTVINHHVLAVKNRMDIETEFMDIIRQNGYEPQILKLELLEDIATAKEARKLQTEEGDPIIRICLLCGADERPAIYTEDVLDKRLVKYDYRDQKALVTIFDFLEAFCEKEVYMDLTELHPRVADKRLAKLLEVDVGSPLLNMEEVDYDIEGVPVFYSNQYFVDEFCQHTVLRKRI